MCLGNLSPIASRISTSDLPTRLFAAANPPRSADSNVIQRRTDRRAKGGGMGDDEDCRRYEMRPALEKAGLRYVEKLEDA
jgi:hypothetical protein